MSICCGLGSLLSGSPNFCRIPVKKEMQVTMVYCLYVSVVLPIPASHYPFLFPTIHSCFKVYHSIHWLLVVWLLQKHCCMYEINPRCVKTIRCSNCTCLVLTPYMDSELLYSVLCCKHVGLIAMQLMHLLKVWHLCLP